MLISFIKDTNDSIRIPIIENLANLKDHHHPDYFFDYLLDMFDILRKDESWRVRYAFAERIDVFLKFCAESSDLVKLLTDTFAEFIVDKEAEVRNISCTKLETVMSFVDKEESIEAILQKIDTLQEEAESFVKLSIASSLLKVCNKCGKKNTTKYILPLFLNLVKDQDHYIRLTLIKNIGTLGETIGADSFIAKIMPFILEINENKVWRVRRDLAEILYQLAQAIPEEVFCEKVLGLCLNLMEDDAYAVRESACKLIKNLMIKFKSADLSKGVITKLSDLIKSTNYLLRNSVLLVVKEFSNESQLIEFIEENLMEIKVIFNGEKFI